MLSKWQWLWAQLTTTLWIRACLFGLFGVVAALIGSAADQWSEIDFPISVAQETVDQILEIMANSMLMVTTFSLSVMVSAYQAATNNVTPRATKLIRQDITTQNVLATFIGAFLFSLVGLIATKTEVYQANGRFVLFTFTLLMIVFIVVAIFRWIEHLTVLGRVGSTSAKVEDATTAALQFYRQHPCLGARRFDDHFDPADFPTRIDAKEVGYVQHIDMQTLQQCAHKLDTTVAVNILPGTMTYPGMALIWAKCDLDEQQQNALANAITIASERTFEQDPRFGICVLTEVAQRALSPAVNDPGTAIDIITRHTRVLAPWRDLSSYDDEEVHCPQVHIHPLNIDDVLADAFFPIARDAGETVEVHIRMHKALKALAEQESTELRAAAIRCAQTCYLFAEQNLQLEQHKEILKSMMLQPD